jgi:pantoate--beta-alanine ligase
VTVSVAANVSELRRLVGNARRAGLKVGLVPTMGALHAGHASLIRCARAQTDFVVVSVFVNPTQFGPSEDLTRYPRPLEADLALCTACGADLVFVPTVEMVYPPDFCTYVEVTGLQDILEGASRPGHFRGVATVVLKLFNLVQPDVAWFGQKDAQQLRIIRQMVRDLDVPVEIRVGPTVREPDGLALSSRNQYLNPPQRLAATALVRALQAARDLYAGGERDGAKLQAAMASVIQATPGAALDYAAVVDDETLEPVTTLRGPTLLALAVHFGSTRLIDNLRLSADGGAGGADNGASLDRQSPQSGASDPGIGV